LRRGRRLRATLALTTVLALGSATGTVWAAFTSEGTNPGNELTAAPDFVGPTAGSSVIQKAEGGIPGYIRQGGGYRVFANVSDSGNPASGVSSATANVTALTTGQSASALTAGSYTAGSTTYNYRSGSLTANSSLAAGTKSYSLALADAAGNTGSAASLSVVVDNTAATASNVQTTNKTGGTNGTPELGDTVTLTYSEQVEPNSVLTGWTGASQNIVVRIDNNVANSTLLPLGTVRLGRTDYVSANTTFGATGTASTMTQSGSAITLTLGTASGSPAFAFGTGTLTWYPSNGATDRAGNPGSTASRAESGTADKDF
jgi:hypothetical protein